MERKEDSKAGFEVCSFLPHLVFDHQLLSILYHWYGSAAKLYTASNYQYTNTHFFIDIYECFLFRVLVVQGASLHCRLSLWTITRCIARSKFNRGGVRLQAWRAERKTGKKT